MPPLLPQLVNFGDREFLPELDRYDPENFNQIPQATESMVPPFGVDIGFDFATGEMSRTSGGDLRIVGETDALVQWCAFALLTPRGEFLIYPESFGSQLSSVFGQGYSPAILEIEVQTKVREAILIHNRIIDVRDFVFSYPRSIGSADIRGPGEGTSVTVSFSIVTDDEESLRFEGLGIG